MAKYPGLVRRGTRGTYWFRRRAPSHLGVAEINLSLRTLDFDTAVERWAVEDAKARKLFANGANVSSVPPVNVEHAVIIAAFEKHLREDEHTYRLARSLKEAEKSSPKWLVLAEKYRVRQRELINQARARAVTLFLVPYDDWLAKHYPEIKLASDELHVALVRAEIRVREALLANDDALLPPAPPQEKVTNQVAPSLSAFAANYINRRGGGLSAGRANTINATVRDLVSVVGDKPVTAYGSADALAFEDVMLSLPANWMKKKGLCHLPLPKAAERAKALGLPRQAAANIRKKWSILSSLFDHATHAHDAKNPFVAKALVVSDNVAANEQRDPFKPAELKALLASELPGPLYWLTWLGLFTGARLNELCQVTKEHVRQNGALHFIYFSPELRLKTGEKESCVRSLPIHSELVKRGFLDFAAESDGRLFPDLKPNKFGYLSAQPSKAFAHHLKRIGIKRPKLSFHSLRHTFAAKLKTAAPRDSETRERLLGHAVSGVAGRYGGSYEAEASDMELLAQRAAVLELVRF